MLYVISVFFYQISSVDTIKFRLKISLLSLHTNKFEISVYFVLFHAISVKTIYKEDMKFQKHLSPFCYVIYL